MPIGNGKPCRERSKYYRFARQRPPFQRGQGGDHIIGRQRFQLRREATDPVEAEVGTNGWQRGARHRRERRRVDHANGPRWLFDPVEAVEPVVGRRIVSQYRGCDALDGEARDLGQRRAGGVESLIRQLDAREPLVEADRRVVTRECERFAPGLIVRRRLVCAGLRDSGARRPARLVMDLPVLLSLHPRLHRFLGHPIDLDAHGFATRFETTKQPPSRRLRGEGHKLSTGCGEGGNRHSSTWLGAIFPSNLPMAQPGPADGTKALEGVRMNARG